MRRGVSWVSKVFSNMWEGRDPHIHPCPSGHGSPVSMKDVTETKNVHGSRKLDPMTPKGSGYGARKLDPMDVTMAS